jgi:hypothetical protein
LQVIDVERIELSWGQPPSVYMFYIRCQGSCYRGISDDKSTKVLCTILFDHMTRVAPGARISRSARISWSRAQSRQRTGGRLHRARDMLCRADSGDSADRRVTNIGFGRIAAVNLVSARRPTVVMSFAYNT